MSGSIKINGTTSGSTTITAPDTGSDETIELSTALASKLDLAGGKILQIVRATDSSSRSTTSTSPTDVTGLSVTITPQKSDSAIIILTHFRIENTSDSDVVTGFYSITDSSDNVLVGANHGTENLTGTSNRYFATSVTLVAYATPATTSPVTYKVRHNVSVAGRTTRVRGDSTASQIFAFEVSA